MHDLIFDFQKKLGVATLINHAEKLGLDVNSFKKCLSEGRYAEGIKRDIQAGKSSGVTGTPSFIIGKLNGNDEIEGSVIRGARPYESFKTAIEAKLEK